MTLEQWFFAVFAAIFALAVLGGLFLVLRRLPAALSTVSEHLEPQQLIVETDPFQLAQKIQALEVAYATLEGKMDKNFESFRGRLDALNTRVARVRAQIEGQLEDENELTEEQQRTAAIAHLLAPPPAAAAPPAQEQHEPVMNGQLVKMHPSLSSRRRGR